MAQTEIILLVPEKTDEEREKIVEQDSMVVALRR
jgi:hypothetical protein